MHIKSSHFLAVRYFPSSSSFGISMPSSSIIFWTGNYSAVARREAYTSITVESSTCLGIDCAKNPLHLYEWFSTYLTAFFQFQLCLLCSCDAIGKILTEGNTNNILVVYVNQFPICLIRMQFQTLNQLFPPVASSILMWATLAISSCDMCKFFCELPSLALLRQHLQPLEGESRHISRLFLFL